ncbi:MAG: acetone carboxylase subunit gamma, partial [Solirubrobacteraceae bacterium]
DSWGQLDLASRDVQYVRFMGGGGYGDPIDRDPEAVARDVAERLVSVAVARDIYGVVLDGAAVDGVATGARRLEIRRARAGAAVDEACLDRARVPATAMRIGEYLQRTAADTTQCTWCGHEVAPAGEDWKEHVTLSRSPVGKAGPLRSEGGGYMLIEAFCPCCGTLLDTDLALDDDPPLHDRIHRWPGC